MVDYHRCFIENMKFYRKKNGFSQAELAEACDVSNGTIGNIECGITKPSFDLIIQIATSLNIKPESLFLSSENNIPDNSDSNKISKDQLKRIKETFTYAINKALEDLNN